jgi:type IX secretion system PorP/SprF family membrane protein
MKKLLLFIFLLPGSILLAQDPHFSQYFASPLSLNPANTGFFDGSFRFAVNERQQWFNVGSNYHTTSISGDVKLIPDRLPENDILAIGAMGLFDSSLGGALQSNYMSVSTAYHKSLAYDGAQILTVGVQFTYANIYLDYNKLSFASQFNGINFDTTIPVYANTTNSSSNYADVHAGLLYAAHLQNTNLYAGVSLYHIRRPVETLFSSSDNRIPFRETFHAGGDLRISPASSILFSMMYMNQASASDKMIGAAYGLKKQDDNNNDFSIYLGMWLRLQDAYIPYIGVDYQNFSVGLNYSNTYNAGLNYKPATFELSLTFRTKSGVSQRCPRF